MRGVSRWNKVETTEGTNVMEGTKLQQSGITVLTDTHGKFSELKPSPRETGVHALGLV